MYSASTFECTSLKELDHWVDALQLLLYHGRDGRGGLAKLRYQLKKYGVVIFFSGEGRVGVRFLWVRLVGVQQWHQGTYSTCM